MKKIWIVLILCTLCISIVFLSFIERSKKKFNASVEYIADRKWRMVYNEPFQEYYFRYYSPPLSIEEVKNYTLPLLGQKLINEFQDPFLKTAGNLLYIPLFDSEYNRAIGFAVISAGIDRKRNFKQESMMSFNDLMELDIFYNSPSPSDGVYYGDFNDTLFSLKKFIFGKRDLLIDLINCEEFYMHSIRYEMPVEQLFQSSVFDNLQNRIDYIFQIEINITTQDLEINFLDNAILVSNASYCIKFIQNPDIELNSYDTIIKLVGTLKSIDFRNKLIVFENCMINSSTLGPGIMNQGEAKLSEADLRGS